MSFTNKSKTKTPGKQTSQTKKSFTNSGTRSLYGVSSTSSSKGNLNLMMKDYKNFCEKYFGNSTPIAAIEQNQFDQMLSQTDNQQNEIEEEDDNYIINEEELKQLQDKVETQMLSQDVNSN